MMNRIRTVSWPLASCLLLLSAPAMGAAVMEGTDRLEINWATHKVRFFGEAQTGVDDDGSALRTAEKRAWQDGLAFARDAVQALNLEVYRESNLADEAQEEAAKNAAKAIATTTSSYNTTYFADGKVRVHLENSLARVLETQAIRFRQREALPSAMTQYSGIVLRLDQPMRPRPIYEIVDSEGARLFAAGDMAQEAFRKNLMGRWFRSPGQDELANYVGTNPVVIEAKVADGGRLVVDREIWDRSIEGHRVHLVNGTIALTMAK